MSHSRRSFVKTTAVVATGALLGRNVAGALPAATSELYRLADEMLRVWGDGILVHQVRDKQSKDYGGLLSPDNGKVPGRCADAIFPLFCLAKKTGDRKYSDAARLLYDWMETHVSQQDGSWLNEPEKNWKGITVFTLTGLCETLKHYAGSMDPGFRKAMEERAFRAANWVHDTFTIDYGNINYPVSASYGLLLAGSVLDSARLRDKGRFFADEAMKFLTKDHLLLGEGHPYQPASKKGCYPVDLGYNVEESLPALAQFGLMDHSEQVLQQVTRCMQAHADFMLPDGGWDNSWGTRNYKWTYWGSRTSDGCQAGFGLLTYRDSRFYSVALKNLQLLKQCTHNGLLYGGTHYFSQGIKPSIHHSFCHMKSLATLLAYGNGIAPLRPDPLPRSIAKGVKAFPSVNTWLLSTGGFRATVTGYDSQYPGLINGHASGGAMTMLWHEKTGPLLCASMNSYQLHEKENMQEDPANAPALTPRIELRAREDIFMNISDLSATVNVRESDGNIIVETKSRLVNAKQQDPPGGPVHCTVSYHLSARKASLHFQHDANVPGIEVIVPVVSASSERVATGQGGLIFYKEHGKLKVYSNAALQQGNRIFNFVPGLAAIPLTASAGNVTVEISIA